LLAASLPFGLASAAQPRTASAAGMSATSSQEQRVDPEGGQNRREKRGLAAKEGGWGVEECCSSGESERAVGPACFQPQQC